VPRAHGGADQDDLGLRGGLIHGDRLTHSGHEL
jgi:hypothetical protein